MKQILDKSVIDKLRDISIAHKVPIVLSGSNMADICLELVGIESAEKISQFIELKCRPITHDILILDDHDHDHHTSLKQLLDAQLDVKSQLYNFEKEVNHPHGWYRQFEKPNKSKRRK